MAIDAVDYWQICWLLIQFFLGTLLKETLKYINFQGMQKPAICVHMSNEIYPPKIKI